MHCLLHLNINSSRAEILFYSVLSSWHLETVSDTTQVLNEGKNVQMTLPGLMIAGDLKCENAKAWAPPWGVSNFGVKPEHLKLSNAEVNSKAPEPTVKYSGIL